MPNTHPTPRSSTDESAPTITRSEQPESTTTEAATSTGTPAEAATSSGKSVVGPAAEARRDEAEAIRSLDITTTQVIPQAIPLWEPAPAEPSEQPHEPARRRISTIALMCVVAIVSFVAGGVTARLSAQMPLVFPQKETPTENTASYVEEPAQQEEPTAENTSYDTGYETGYDTTDNTTDETPYVPEGISPTTQDESDDSDTSYTWNLDNEGDSSLTYDYDSDEVTFDYNGHSLTVDLEELLDGYDDDSSDDDDWSHDSNPPHGYDTNDSYVNRTGWGTRW